MADDLPIGTREGHGDMALQQMRAALSILSDLTHPDARSLPWSLVRLMLQGAHDRLRLAHELITKAQDDDRDQG